MALPSQIEVHSGGDMRLYVGLWLVWLAALLNIVIHWQAMALALQLVSFALLMLSIPRRSVPSLKAQKLRLHASGNFSCDESQGRWHSNTWRNPWYTVIRVRTEDKQWWAWISASRNSPDVYRRLGIWCRYSPQQSAEKTGTRHLP